MTAATCRSFFFRAVLATLLLSGCGPLPPALIRSQSDPVTHEWPTPKTNEHPSISVVLHAMRRLNDEDTEQLYSISGTHYPIAEAALKAALIESGQVGTVHLGRADADLTLEVRLTTEADTTGGWNEFAEFSLELVPAEFSDRYRMHVRILDRTGREIGNAQVEEDVRAWRSLILSLPVMPIFAMPFNRPQPESLPCRIYWSDDQIGCTILLGMARKALAELARSGAFDTTPAPAESDAPLEAAASPQRVELPADVLPAYPRRGLFALQAGAGYGGLGDANYLGAHGPAYGGAATFFFTEPGLESRTGVRVDFSYVDARERTLGIWRDFDIYQISGGFEFGFPGRESLENFEFYAVVNGGVAIRRAYAFWVLGPTLVVSPTKGIGKTGTAGAALGLKYFPTESAFVAFEMQDVIVFRRPWAINWGFFARAGFEF